MLTSQKIKEQYLLKKDVFDQKQIETNLKVDEAKELYESGDDSAIEEYCDLVLTNSEYPEILNRSWKINFTSSTKMLLVDYELPSVDSLPMIDSYKYVKSKNAIDGKPMTAAKVKELYDDFLYQLCIRTVHEIAEADVSNHIQSIVFNGNVSALNKGTGNIEDKTIMTVLVDKEEFNKVNLSNVVAQNTFEHFNGIAGKSLFDLTSVTPLSSVKESFRVPKAS